MKTLTVLYVEVEPDKGSHIAEVLADALEYAMVHRVNVAFTFNERRYTVNWKNLLEIVSSQFPK